jgi:uncharacterized protein (TIGR02444 family)
MTDAALEGPHWRFALRLYGRPGVADACLLLQDRLGVDVNVLLVSLHAGAERGLGVDARAVQHMDDLGAPWRDEVVFALRKIRRRMKSGPAPAPGTVTGRLRDEIKRAELHAEQIQQATLAGWLKNEAAARPPAPVDIGCVLRTVVTHYAAARGRADDAESPDVQRAMQTILAARGLMPAAEDQPSRCQERAPR